MYIYVYIHAGAPFVGAGGVCAGSSDSGVALGELRLAAARDALAGRLRRVGGTAAAGGHVGGGGERRGGALGLS